MKSAIVVALFAVGCASHIAPYKAKHRVFEQGKYGNRSSANNGSLYAEGATGLFEDPVASRIGDILVIKIDEKDLASHQADTTLKKSDATSYGLPSAFGLVAALQKKYPNIDPTSLFSSTSNVNFTGNGAIQRQGQVTATLPVRVVDMLPSGDLVVEGEKAIMTGDEEHHIYMSGTVRKIDIADDDTIPSSRVADAEVEYTGKGDISDTQRRGWLNRLLTKIWPF
ncbi:MAG TPA: flagellar basal body L-ring protein FlgH [Kofleriaceae bacterium]|jgi:flagellar L-ring protein precursor FlgH